MRSMIVYGTYCVPILSSGSHAQVSAENVTNAFRTAPTVQSWGSYVGPAPRITRGRFDQCVNQVNASWLFEYPEPSSQLSPDELTQYDDIIRRNLQERLQSTLRDATAGGGWMLSFLPYSPSLHGSRDWWASGEASRTRTYQSADLGDRENPVGPNSVHPPEVGPTDALRQWIANNKGIVIGAGVFVGLGVTAIIAVKVMDRTKRMDLGMPYGPIPQPPYPIQSFGPIQPGLLPPQQPAYAPPTDKQLSKTITKSKSQLARRK
jgi:hypothetical protein